MARETLRRLVAPAELSAANERDWHHSSLSNSADRIQLLVPARSGAASSTQVEHAAVRTADHIRGQAKSWLDAKAEEAM
jgi:hypothetical protein